MDNKGTDLAAAEITEVAAKNGGKVLEKAVDLANDDGGGSSNGGDTLADII